MEISTSILNIKEEECIKTFYNLETAGTDYFHIDVMDGEFVENNTIILMNKYCEYLKNITNIPLDVHLMVKDVMSYINNFLVYEPRNITIHFEATQNKIELIKWINYIKRNNCKVGISIKPTTSIEEIYDLLPLIHTVLIMTVEPGKGGQEIIPSSIEKISKLKKYIAEKNIELDIEVDGGINFENIDTIKKAGTDIAVVGTAIINSDNFRLAIKKLKND